MKKLLIIYPHFPPSNLAGVHRPRLFANHLSEFGWEPVILTVHENFYEEEPDQNLVKLLPKHLRIEKVNAWKIRRPRLVGDIGIRSFFQLYRRAKNMLTNEKFDFIYIPIPSFYCALLGRWLHERTGIPYGIDYIDPWVHNFPGSDKLFSRHWLSTKLSSLLEPVAVKKASLITGVAEGYFAPVIVRNPHLKYSAVTGAMPYGGEKHDHVIASQLNIQPYLFKQKAGKVQLIYAGAMLPKAYAPLEEIFKSMSAAKELFQNTEIHFIGTGSRTDDPLSFNIKPLAEKYGLWQTNVYEYPKRIPYLDVLIHLNIATGIFILGSTESHYTPSKTYQGVLSGKPLIAVLHERSTAVDVIRKSAAGMVLSFNGEAGLNKIGSTFAQYYTEWMQFAANFRPGQVDTRLFEQYSAQSVTGVLAGLLNKAISDHGSGK